MKTIVEAKELLPERKELRLLAKGMIFFATFILIPQTKKMQSVPAITDDMRKSFDQVVDSTEAFVAIDYGFTFLFVNKKAEGFYKKSLNELVGQNVQDMFPAQWDFGPFKEVRRNVVARKAFEINYHSPFANEWVKLSGKPFENYFIFTYRTIDYKSVLRDELRNQVSRFKA